MKAPLVVLTLFSFLITGIIGPIPAYPQEYRLPAPGVMVHLSPPFNPPILKGIKVHPDDPLRFDFILDQGDSHPLEGEGRRLIKYFLASLTIPENDLWVNLSPYEKDRIIPNSFGLTEMGRDLLAEDYMLKQITASLIYPEDEVGKKFWKRIYEEASKKFGTTDIPVNTFNKVWIVPDKAVVYENAAAGTAYVVESQLKVLLEQDYLALEKAQPTRGHVQERTTQNVSPSLLPTNEGLQLKAPRGNNRPTNEEVSALGSQIVREVVIPQLTKEVNEDKNFAKLRQVYNSLILATWYKKKIRDSILAQVYANKNKVAGVSIDDPQEKEKIYQRYLQAFKKGVYNYIKEDIDPLTQEQIPRKYFSGGESFEKFRMDRAMTIVNKPSYLKNILLSIPLLLSISCQIMSYAPKNYPTLDIPVINDVPQQSTKRNIDIKLFWAQLQKNVGNTGEKRLKDIVDFNDIGKISQEEKSILGQLAETLSQKGGGQKGWSDNDFELFKQALALNNKPMSIKEIVSPETYSEIIFNFKATPRPLLEKYINMYQRLFKGVLDQNIQLRSEILSQFLSKMIENRGKDMIFLENVLKEFPQLFNPSINYSLPFEERTQNAVTQLNALPSFSTVKDPLMQGYEAFNNDAARQLLRRYLLAILNFDLQAFPIDESRRAKTLMMCILADIGQDLGADSSGEIGFPLLTMPALKAILGHEIGHNIDPFGLTKNMVLNEFVADTWAYLEEQRSGEDLRFQKTTQDIANKMAHKMLFSRALSILIGEGDFTHDGHHFARLQIKNLLKILGNNINWKVIHEALESMVKDYQKGGLKTQLRDFIDNRPDAMGIMYFDSFTMELSTRYMQQIKGPMPKTKIIEESVKGGPIKTIKLLDSAMASQAVLELEEVTFDEQELTEPTQGVLSALLAKLRINETNKEEFLKFLGVEERDFKQNVLWESRVEGMHTDVLKHALTWPSLGIERIFYDKPKVNYLPIALENDIAPRVMVYGNRVLELDAPGKSLNDWSLDFNSPQETKSAVESLARALATLHALGYLHGDLDPSKHKGSHVYIEKIGAAYKTRFIDFADRRSSANPQARSMEKNQLIDLIYQSPADFSKNINDRDLIRTFNDAYENKYTQIKEAPAQNHPGNGASNTGGIDLRPANMNLQANHAGGEIKFQLDPAMLEQLHNAPGFIPVIVNVQPLKDLPDFLGINKNDALSVDSNLYSSAT